MRPWTKRASQLARQTVQTLGRAARSDTTPQPPSTTAAEADVSPGDLGPGLFLNPVGEGADPSVVRDGDRFLWCQAEGNVAVSIWVSDRLTSMGRKYVVWRADSEGPASKEVWAPELVRLDGRWHIYFAASDGKNRNHRTFVLVADTDDVLGPYTLHGPLFTGDDPGGDSLWSIDFTVLEHGGRRYGMWSGWPDLDTDLQHLYAAEMASPTEISGGRTLIAQAGVHDWERVDETAATRGLLEGPRPLVREGKVFVLFSCAASWLPTYKLGMLELTGDDPLDPGAWFRYDHPVFQSSTTTCGVGHGTFVDLGEEWWHVFHAKIDEGDGWRRTLHAQPMTFTEKAFPSFGPALPRGVELRVPTGTPVTPRRDGGSWGFRGADSLDDFDYYGHHQFYAVGAAGLDLGVVPAEPVNDFRSSEKVVLRDGDFADVEIEVTFSFVAGRRAAGVLFRVTGPSVGPDAQRGYFAGLAQDRRTLVLGKTDGTGWTTLAEASILFDAAAPRPVKVRAVGDHLVVTCGDARIDIHDSDYKRGSVGLRVVDTHARFTTLTVRPVASDSPG